MENKIIDFITNSYTLGFGDSWFEKMGELPEFRHSVNTASGPEYNHKYLEIFNHAFITTQMNIIAYSKNPLNPLEAESMDKLLKKLTEDCPVECVFHKTQDVTPTERYGIEKWLRVPNREYSEVIGTNLIQVNSIYKFNEGHNCEGQNFTFENNLVKKVNLFLFPSKKYADEAIQRIKGKLGGSWNKLYLDK